MRDAPFAPDDISFILWMTREEWQLAHGLSFAWVVHGIMPDQPTLGAAYRYVIRELQENAGYEWRGLHLNPNTGELWPTREVVEPNNQLTIDLMRNGAAPDYEVHVAGALAYAERAIPALDVEPLRAVQDDLRRVVKRIDANIDNLSPKEKAEIDAAMAEREQAFFGEYTH